MITWSCLIGTLPENSQVNRWYYKSLRHFSWEFSGEREFELLATLMKWGASMRERGVSFKVGGSGCVLRRTGASRASARRYQQISICDRCWCVLCLRQYKWESLIWQFLVGFLWLSQGAWLGFKKGLYRGLSFCGPTLLGIHLVRESVLSPLWSATSSQALLEGCLLRVPVRCFKVLNTG